MYNWTTLNQKVFRRLGFLLEKEEYLPATNGEPGAIERILKLVRARIAERGFLRQNPGAVPRQNPGSTPQGSAKGARHAQGDALPGFGKGEEGTLAFSAPQGNVLREPARAPLQQGGAGGEVRETLRAQPEGPWQNLGSASSAAAVWRAGAGAPGHPQAVVPSGGPGQHGDLAPNLQDRLTFGDAQVCTFVNRSLILKKSKILKITSKMLGRKSRGTIQWSNRGNSNERRDEKVVDEKEDEEVMVGGGRDEKVLDGRR